MKKREWVSRTPTTPTVLPPATALTRKFVPDWVNPPPIVDLVRSNRLEHQLDQFNLHPDYRDAVSDILDEASPKMQRLARRLSKRVHARNFGTKAALEVLMRVGMLLASLDDDPIDEVE